MASVTRIEKYISAMFAKYGKYEFSRSELKKASEDGLNIPGDMWKCKASDERGSGFSIKKLAEMHQFEFDFNNPASDIQPIQKMPCDSTVNSELVKQILEPYDISMYIPQVDPGFVVWGTNYDMIFKIIQSNDFFPCYIYGIAGVGKTSSIEHACAVLNKPFFRIQITQETTDEDLIGSMKLIDGNTVWQDGPIIKAYRAGAICVLDEIDLNAGLMILQGILEKKPFYIKQTGELVEPQEGFNIFATGNTKGDGEGIKYIGTTSLNDAFLDRFAISLKQSFCPISEERKIIKKFCSINSIEVPSDLMKEFIKFIDTTRKAYSNDSDYGNGEAVFISSRRIGFILKAYKITNDMTSALDMALSRYDNDNKQALMMMWTAISSAENEECYSANCNYDNSENI